MINGPDIKLSLIDANLETIQPTMELRFNSGVLQQKYLRHRLYRGNLINSVVEWRDVPEVRDGS